MRLPTDRGGGVCRGSRNLLRNYPEGGRSKRALARQLDVSRDTIHRWIREGDLDRDLETPVHYGLRRPVAAKLTAYILIVEARLAAYPRAVGGASSRRDSRGRLRRPLY